MILPDEDVISFNKLFSYIYKGNAEACTLAMNIISVLHIWDDLIDKDKSLTDEEINGAFLTALVSIGGSTLWTPDIAANMFNVYLRWHDANVIEKRKQATDNELAKAWMLRAGCYDLFVLLAVKLYGLDWGNHIGPIVRDWYGETLEDFIEEVRSCQDQ